jgi:hypothetical protein
VTNNNSIIIFHRSKHNSEEDLANQRAFLEANRKIIGSAKVIDYMTSDDVEARKIFEVFRNINTSDKVIVIVSSFLLKKSHYLQYNMYHYFRFFKASGIVPMSMYLMDHEGRLYKETETVETL